MVATRLWGWKAAGKGKQPKRTRDRRREGVLVMLVGQFGGMGM